MSIEVVWEQEPVYGEQLAIENLVNDTDIGKEKTNIISEIDDEILREYTILNKYTTEKFSIILVILGFIGLIVASWDIIKTHIIMDEFLSLWILATFILLTFWMYSVYTTMNSVRKGQAYHTITIQFLKRKFEELINIGTLQELIDNANKKDEPADVRVRKYVSKIINYLLLNFDYVAKNTEARMRPIALFFLTLFFIGIIYIKNYFGVSIPEVQQTSIILHLPLSWLIIFYAALFFILGFWWNMVFAVGKIFLRPLEYGLNIFSSNYTKMRENFEIFFLGLAILTIYTIFFIVLAGFLIIFPFYIDYKLLTYYSIIEMPDLTIKLIFILLFLYLFFKLFEILFSIHLVERMKNDKITWLKQIKFDLISCIDNEYNIIHEAKIRLKLADLYSPIPYTSLAAFTRYEIIPIYRYDVDFIQLQQRLEFLNKH